MAAVELGRWGGWAFKQIEVEAQADKRTAIVAAVTGKRLRLLCLAGKADVAGTITLENGSTACSGAMSVVATDPLPLPLIRPEDAPFMALMQADAGAAINLTTVSCAFNGLAIYAEEV